MVCPAAQLIVSTLEGSSEAALLLNIEGSVLHKNPPAERLFETGQDDDDDDGDDARTDVSSFLFFSGPEKSWEEVAASLSTEAAARHDATGFKKDGTAFFASVSLTRLGGCPCCDSVYACAYVGTRDDDSQQPSKNPKHDELRRLQRMQDIVDASFDAMFSINEGGIILMANGAAMKLFGWTYEEFIGSSISMICGGVHSERHDEYMKRYLETGITRIMGKKREVWARKKDGSEFPVELGIKEIKSNRSSSDFTDRFFCAFIKDLSDQKKHDMELKFMESLCQGMVNSSFDPMFQIDERGIICVVNQAAVDVFGWTREEFLGSNISMICGGEHGQKHGEYISRYLSTGDKHVIGRKRPTIARRKDGSEFDIELGVQEVRSTTGERMFCGYVHDSTQQILDKQKLMKKDALIKQKFFEGGDAMLEGGDTNKAGRRRFRHSRSTM